MPQFGIFVVKYVINVTVLQFCSHVNDKACGDCSIFKTNNEIFAPKPPEFLNRALNSACIHSPFTSNIACE